MTTVTEKPSTLKKESSLVSEQRKALSWREWLQKNLLGIVGGSAGVSLILFLGSLVSIGVSYQQTQKINQKQVDVQEYGDQIVYIDEVLTMSARMGASTGDRSWQTRYDSFEPKLDLAIKGLIKIAPEAYQNYAQQTDSANQKLISLEQKAFDLTLQGKNQEALKLVLSREYEELKKLYSESFQNTYQQIQVEIKKDLNLAQNRFILSLICGGISLIISLICWFVLISLIREYIQEKNKVEASLLSAQEDLFSLTENLELELEKRTEKLREREQIIRQENETLQAEVENILEVVSAAEEGNLTLSVEVGTGVTGLVADTLNRFLEAFGRIVSVAISTTNQVSEEAKLLEKVAINTANGVQKQAQSLGEIQKLMLDVNNISQENLELNQKTSEAVFKSELALNSGLQEMNTMTYGIITLSTETEQIVKRLEFLEDFVTSASEVGKEQKRIVAKVKVLGLNASLVAEKAEKETDPEQFFLIAQEFATIAQQINDLANLTSESLLTLQQRTEQMQTMASGFNQDVQNINQLTVNFTDTVNNTSEAFDLIKSEIQQLTFIEQQLTESSNAIAMAAQTTFKELEDITLVALDTESQANTTREKATLMQQLSKQLLDIVRFFTVTRE
jgi:twitching motility protein PilJ